MKEMQRDYSEDKKAYQSGRHTINVTATTLVIKTFKKVIEQVNRDLNDLLAPELDGNMKKTLVKKFVVDYMQLDMAEIHLYCAFKAGKDEIFYLP